MLPKSTNFNKKAKKPNKRLDLTCVYTDVLLRNWTQTWDKTISLVIKILSIGTFHVDT